MKIQPLRTVLLCAAALGVAACGGDRALPAVPSGEVDPALTSALEDQITVDPALTQQSNQLAVRPPETPTQVAYPLPLDAAQAERQVVSGCGSKFDYDPDWAGRLPPPFSIPHGGRIAEAAGADAPDCSLRVVVFTSPAPPQQILGWYQPRVAGAGFSVQQQQRGDDLIMAGFRGKESYFLVVTPIDGGSEVSLIADASG